MPYFKTKDNCDIYYETKNLDAFEILVFINGTLQTTLNWRSHAEALKDRFGIILYDTRTQGRSSMGEQSLSPECHIADLRDLLDHLAVDKVNFIGVSHGAYIALTFGAHRPERVKKMVLCGAGAEHSPLTRVIIRSWINILKQGGLEAMAWAALPMTFGEKFLKQNENILDNIVKAIVTRNRKGAVQAHLEAIVTYPKLSLIAQDVSIPILLLSGSEDPLVNPDSAQRLAQICGGRHEIIRRAGHAIPAEVPQLFNKMTAEFLGG